MGGFCGCIANVIVWNFRVANLTDARRLSAFLRRRFLLMRVNRGVRASLEYLRTAVYNLNVAPR